MKKYIFLVAILGFTMSGCLDNAKSSYKNEVCVASFELLSGVSKCKDGQVLSFQPQRWGNEQLPIIVSTYYCDFNYPIVQNKAGVTCVYKRRFNAEEDGVENNSSK